MSRTYNIPSGDFPDVAKFRHTLATSEACRDFSKFKKLDDKLLQQLDAIIRENVGELMSEFEAIPSPDYAAVPDVSAATTARSPTSPAVPSPEKSPPVRPPEGASEARAAAAPSATSTSIPASSTATSTATQPAVYDSGSSTDPWAASTHATSAHATSMVDGLFRKPTPTPTPAPTPPPTDGPFGRPVSSPGLATSSEATTALVVAGRPWAVSSSEKEKYDKIFRQMGGDQGLVPGSKVAPVLKRSGLDTGTLKAIWKCAALGLG